jgi:protein-tyrosine phosphatase
MKKKKILMVCLGNICRSPLAEGILSNKCKSLAVDVDSAGTAAYHVGKAPDPRSQNIASINRIEIKNQKARALKQSDLIEFDTIYVMDQSNYENTLKLAVNDAQRGKVKMILNVSKPGSNKEVPDPYYGGNDGFKQVFDLLNEACEIIKNQLELELNGTR